MKKLFLCLFASAISISGYSQLASPQEHIGRMQRLMEDATQDYQAQRWDACEERLNQYVALYTELRAVDSTAVQPTWLYVPSAMLGSIAEQQEDWGKAIEFYEYALIISTQYPNEILAGGVDMNTYIGVWISLKEAYQKHGNNETALDLAKEIVKVCRAHLPDDLSVSAWSIRYSLCLPLLFL